MHSVCIQSRDSNAKPIPMFQAGLPEIKQELKSLSASELAQVVQRLARFRKENKELISFLIFHEHDLNGYLEFVKAELEAAMLDVRPDRPYLAKKTIRKVLRLANKHIRFTGSKQAEAELLIHLCGLLQGSGIDLDRNPVIGNIFRNQLQKADKAIEALHEDLQYDLKRFRAKSIRGD
jgi:hypothetical protein